MTKTETKERRSATKAVAKKLRAVARSIETGEVSLVDMAAAAALFAIVTRDIVMNHVGETTSVQVPPGFEPEETK